MSSSDDEYNVRHYSELVSKYGLDVRSLDWGSVESQRLRFRVLAQIADIEGASILDVGCGLGDFYSWMRELKKEVTYTGIDITPRMIELATQRFPEGDFRNSTIEALPRTSDHTFDLVFASGIFGKLRIEPAAAMKDTIRSMYGICKRGVAFNSLSAWADQQEADEFHADPIETLIFCRTLTPWVSLRHDYHGRDFTIYMYRHLNR